MTRHWPILVAVILLPIAYLLGRRTGPERIVTVDKVRVETKTVEVVRTVTVKAVVAESATTAATRTVTKVVYRWLPGGAVEAVQTTQAATDTTAHETKQERAGATTDATRTADVRIDQTHTTERTDRPGWSFGVQAGAQLAGTKAFSLYGPLVIGATVERRLFGPLWAGAFASTSGAGGIGLRWDL